MKNTNTVATNWQDELKALKYEHIKASTPNAFAASGGYDMKIKNYNDADSNGLTNAIIDYLKFKGHYGNRTNTVGIVRKVNGKAIYTPSTSNRGVSDVTAIVGSVFVGIEIKIGRDKMSIDQHKEQKRVESAGGKYFVATSMPSFLEWFKKTFPL